MALKEIIYFFLLIHLVARDTLKKQKTNQQYLVRFNYFLVDII